MTAYEFAATLPDNGHPMTTAEAAAILLDARQTDEANELDEITPENLVEAFDFIRTMQLRDVQRTGVFFQPAGPNVSTMAFDDNQISFGLFRGIPDLDGGWMLETNGYPIDETSLTDASVGTDTDFNAAQLGSVRQILSDPRTSWAAVDAEDIVYLAGWLRAWGF